MSQTTMHLAVSALHLVDGLGSGLYEDVGQRVMELVRNGLVASMPDSNKWEPKRAKIEILFVQNHRLAPKNCATLIVLDHGSGMTDAGFQRYFGWLGTPLSELRKYKGKGSFQGASQKGIGRLAALALNERCLDDDIEVRISNGYYILSRTQAEGDVRFVPVIPEEAEVSGFNTRRLVSPNSTEMGPLKGIEGSFTAVVIPTPVFSSSQEIYDAIRWHLPRERDKMFSLTIGGKDALPPPLETSVNITSPDGRYRARIGANKDERGEGLWLCDEVTGFRVASCQKIGRLLPEPLWFPDLSGDIFAPNLMRHQNTSRSSLNKEFTRKRNKEWEQLTMFLIRQVVPAAQQLVERDTITGDAAEALDDVVDMFNQRFGEPEEDLKPSRPKDGNSSGTKPSTGNPTSRGTATAPQFRRHISIKVKDDVYLLYRGQNLGPFEYAQVNINDPRMIIVNVRGGYRALPDQKLSRREHCLMQVLGAIGRSKFPMDPHQAMCFANEVRSEFNKK